MKKQTIVYSFVLLLTFSITGLKAQTSSVNVTTTAVPFLRINPDARGGGMGDLGIATSPDANSSFWNLAKTPFTTANDAIGVTYTPWLKDLGLNDVYLASLAGYHKLGDDKAISASIRYFNLGNIQFTDFAGNALNTYNPREFSFDLGYSLKLSDKLGLGIALRYINSNLASGTVNGVTYKAGNAVSGDVSLFHDGKNQTGNGFTWGLSLSNLGSKISYTDDPLDKDYIPANLGLGITYTTVFDPSNRMTFGLDINKLLVPAPPVATGITSTDSAALASYRSSSVISSWFKSFSGTGSFQTVTFSLGAEYNYNDLFFLRAGYFYENPSQGDRQFFSAGVGFKYEVANINFSYLVPSGNGVTRNPLSNTLRLGISFDLDKGSDRKF